MNTSSDRTSFVPVTPERQQREKMTLHHRQHEHPSPPTPNSGGVLSPPPVWPPHQDDLDGGGAAAPTTVRKHRHHRADAGTPDTAPDSDDRSALLADHDHHCYRLHRSRDSASTTLGSSGSDDGGSGNGVHRGVHPLPARPSPVKGTTLIFSPGGVGGGAGGRNSPRLDHCGSYDSHYSRASSGGGNGKGQTLWFRLLCSAAVALLAGTTAFLVGYERGRNREQDRASLLHDNAAPSASTVSSAAAETVATATISGNGDAEDDVKDSDDDNEGEDGGATTTRRAFVCITGQLPRLEMRNKITHLFDPLRLQYGLSVDVALILSDSDHASNHHTQIHESQEYYSVDDVVKELQPHVNQVLNAELDEQSASPIVPEVYFEQLGKKDRMTRKEQRERVRNHLRQFESISKCHRWMVSTGREYEVVHRIRDDTGYYAPVNYTTVSSFLSQSPRTILSSACAQHGGINDRGSFVTPLAAYDYFNHPILHMYTQPIGPEIDNSEKFLKVTYERTVDNMAVMDDLYLLKFVTKEEQLDGVVGGEEKSSKGLKKGGKRDKKPKKEEVAEKGFYHKSDRDCIAKYGLNPDGL